MDSNKTANNGVGTAFEGNSYYLLINKLRFNQEITF